MGKLTKVAGVLVGLVVTAAVASAQAATPAEVVQGTTATATAMWTGMAGLSAAAFAFAMLIGFGRKGRK